MKWDVKHDRAKKVLNHFLDNAGYWTEVENLTDGLTEEEIREVNAEVTTMIQSITKRYKLDVMLPADPVVEEKPQEEVKAEHHLVFGTAGRELSEKDGLKVPVCNNCHNMGEILMRIHGNPMAERMSKIIGQLAWEKEYALQKADEFARIIDEGREEGEVKQIIHKGGRETFRKRYGCSYL